MLGKDMDYRMETSLKETFIDPVSLPRRWDEHLAHFVSDILCPPVTVLIGIILIVRSIKDPGAWIWAAIIVLLIIGVPVGYIAWNVRAGAISDFHIPIRSQRFRPMLLTVLCTLAAWAVLQVGKAPELLRLLVAFGVVQAAGMFIITLRWKISGHSAAIAGLAVLLVNLVSPALYPALLLIPLVVWARIRLHRHTLAQTIAGVLSGIIYIGLVLK